MWLQPPFLQCLLEYTSRKYTRDYLVCLPGSGLLSRASQTRLDDSYPRYQHARPMGTLHGRSATQLGACIRRSTLAGTWAFAGVFKTAGFFSAMAQPVEHSWLYSLCERRFQHPRHSTAFSVSHDPEGRTEHARGIARLSQPLRAPCAMGHPG